MQRVATCCFVLLLFGVVCSCRTTPSETSSNPPPTTQEDARGGCDGVVDGRYGFCTAEEDNPWWEVDLRRPESLHRVVIYNRCDQTAGRARTLTVQVSRDRREWHTAYRHKGTAFYGVSDNQPLVVGLFGHIGRYVRIALTEKAPLHVDEIEVYGVRSKERNLAIGMRANQSSTSRWSTPKVVWLDRPLGDSSRGMLVGTYAESNTPNRYPVVLKIKGSGRRELSSVVAGPGKTLTLDPTSWIPGPYEIHAQRTVEGESRDMLRFSWFQGDREAFVSKRLAEREKVRVRFGLDRPQEVLADAADDVRRYRGMAGLLLECLEREADPEAPAPLVPLIESAAMLDALVEGNPLPPVGSNDTWWAYHSIADGSSQPFVLTLPSGFDPTLRYPLLVRLHGRRRQPPWPDPTRITKNDWIEVAPWGRGDLAYEGMGRVDVLSVIEYMRTWYRIDSRRIYLTGSLMGGAGAVRLACQYPDLFAAVSVSGAAEGAIVSAMLENLRNVPLTNDDAQSRAPTSLTQYLLSRLEGIGYGAQNTENPNIGHRRPDTVSISAWLLKHHRRSNPAGVTYVSETPDAAMGQWARIRRFTNPHRPARVDANRIGEGDGVLALVDVDNVDVLELDPVAMGAGRHDDLTVQVGGGRGVMSSPLPDRVFVMKRGTAWVLLDRWAPRESGIRPYRPGAAANLYTGEPLLIVYGTQGDAHHTAMLRVSAERLSRFGGGGRDGRSVMVRGAFPVKADTAVTDHDLKRCNVVLLGGAEHNTLTAKILDRLPLEVTKEKTLVAGGRTPVNLKQAGMRLVHYNPLAPERLVFLVATDATNKAATAWYAAPRRYMTGAGSSRRGDQPDVVVEGLDGSDRRRMQFTNDWRWREVEHTTIPLAVGAGTARALAEARLRALHRVTGAEVAFWWGSSQSKQVLDPRWFGRADLAIAVSPSRTLLCTMTGEELLEIQEKWMGEENLTVQPDLASLAIQRRRNYRVAMPPELSVPLGYLRKRELSNVKAGPDVPAKDFLVEVFGH